MLNFYRGASDKYLAIKDQIVEGHILYDAIYFTNDTNEIYINGTTYGISDTQLKDKVAELIGKALSLKKDENGDLTATGGDEVNDNNVKAIYNAITKFIDYKLTDIDALSDTVRDIITKDLTDSPEDSIIGGIIDDKINEAHENIHIADVSVNKDELKITITRANNLESPEEYDFSGAIDTKIDDAINTQLGGNIQNIAKAKKGIAIDITRYEQSVTTQIDGEDVEVVEEQVEVEQIDFTQDVQDVVDEKFSEISKELADAKDDINSKIAGVYKFQGTITLTSEEGDGIPNIDEAVKEVTDEEGNTTQTVNDKPLKNGYVFNIASPVMYNDAVYPEGTNFAWTVDESGVGSWDALAGIDDLSNYVTKDEITDTLKEYATTEDVENAVDDKLTEYSTTDEITDTLKEYATTEDVKETLKDYAKTVDVSTAVAEIESYLKWHEFPETADTEQTEE